MRGDRMAKRSSFGKSIRKRLSDITNYQPQPKSPIIFDQILPFNDSSPSSSTKDQIDHLLKENARMMMLITEKNKMIEANGIELQKVRFILQKTQLQNWNLAQSNSHMMAEVHIGKQKLKTLQHQLTCKDALLKAIKLEREQKGDNVDTEQKTAKKKIRPIRSQSIGPLMTAVERVSGKETVDNKRRCVRRQSARFKSNEMLFEIEDLKLHEDVLTEPLKDEKCRLNPESGRMSFGRPSRRAAEKIQSYKETPLNIKMRRPD